MPNCIATNTRLTGKLEIHLDLSLADCFSKWAAKNLCTGIEIRLYGPIGRMLYRFSTVNQAILLAAKNAGLSALIGLLQDVFSHEHQGAIYLFHEVDDQAQLYLGDELNQISDYYPNFHYIPCVIQLSEHAPPAGEANKRIRQTVPDLTGWQAYICGPKDFVNTIQKQAYLAGGNMKEIFVDITK